MVVLAIFGGIDTTRNQLGLAMSVFVDNPEQWALLGQHPELARGAVEEVMRTRPTTTWVTREALEDITFKGVLIAKGTTVHLFAESAGTDPAAFPHGLDITLERKSHYGFGAGPHHCLGHFIARADMAEALRFWPSDWRTWSTTASPLAARQRQHGSHIPADQIRCRGKTLNPARTTIMGSDPTHRAERSHEMSIAWGLTPSDADQIRCPDKTLKPSRTTVMGSDPTHRAERSYEMSIAWGLTPSDARASIIWGQTPRTGPRGHMKCQLRGV